MSEREAKELADDMAEEPTLDAYFDRNPKELSDADLKVLVERERRKRIEFIEKDGSK